MTNEGYRTVFDVTTVGFKSWSFPAFGLIFVVIGLVLPLFIKGGSFRKLPAPAEKWFPRVFLGFAVFWTATAFLSTFADYKKAQSAIEKKEALFVEGQVTDFHPMPVTGHASESFAVRGVQFKYSDYVITAGFNNTASHGGPIREGLLVRIWYRDGEILRLDVKEEKPIQIITAQRASRVAD